MAILIQDEFDEVSTTDIEAHTPDVGTGWTEAGNAEVTVNAGGGYAESNTSFGSGHRVTHTDAISVSECDIVGTFPGASGNFRFWGVYGRWSTLTAEDGLDFTYDNGSGTGQWVLGADTNVEAYPSGDVEMKLEIRNGVAKGYANGVEKVSVTTDPNPTGDTFVGFNLGNFNGIATSVQILDFRVDDVLSPPPVLSRYRAIAHQLRR